MDLHAALASVPALSSLQPDELDVLARTLVVGEYRDGHAFIREGQSGTTAYLLLAGKVRVTRTRRSAHDELNVLGPGEFFGLVALVDEAPRSANCVADGPVTVAALAESAFRLLYNARAPVAFALQRALADQLARDFRNLDRRIRAASRA